MTNHELAPGRRYVHQALAEYVQAVETALLHENSNTDPGHTPRVTAHAETTIDEEGNTVRSVTAGQLLDANLPLLQFKEYWHPGEDAGKSQPYARSLEWAYGTGQPPKDAGYLSTSPRPVNVWGGGVTIYDDLTYENWVLVAESNANVNPDSPKESCVTGNAGEDNQGLGGELQRAALHIALDEVVYAPREMITVASNLALALRQPIFKQTRAGHQLAFSQTEYSRDTPFPEATE